MPSLKDPSNSDAKANAQLQKQRLQEPENNLKLIRELQKEKLD